MSFTPLHDRVVVRRLESEEKTAGGLIIPDSAKEKPAKVKLCQLELEPEMSLENVYQWISKLETKFYLESGLEQK
jgi:co-chaperonin GroES (HSP10)